MGRDRHRSLLRVFLPNEEGLCIMLDPFSGAEVGALRTSLRREGFNAVVLPHPKMAAEEVRQALEAIPQLTLIFGGASFVALLKYVADMTVKPFSEAFFRELGRRMAEKVGKLTHRTATATRAAAEEQPVSLQVEQIYDGPVGDVIVFV